MDSENMETYVILGNWTKEGIKGVKNTKNRLESAQKLAKSMGGEIKQIFYTLGKYDFISIVEAPNKASISKALLILGGEGAVRTVTLSAFNSEEFQEIVKDLP